MTKINATILILFVWKKILNVTGKLLTGNVTFLDKIVHYEFPYFKNELYFESSNSAFEVDRETKNIDFFLSLTS